MAALRQAVYALRADRMDGNGLTHARALSSAVCSGYRSDSHLPLNAGRCYSSPSSRAADHHRHRRGAHHPGGNSRSRRSGINVRQWRAP